MFPKLNYVLKACYSTCSTTGRNQQLQKYMKEVMKIVGKQEQRFQPKDVMFGQLKASGDREFENQSFECFVLLCVRGRVDYSPSYPGFANWLIEESEQKTWNDCIYNGFLNLQNFSRLFHERVGKAIEDYNSDIYRDFTGIVHSRDNNMETDGRYSVPIKIEGTKFYKTWHIRGECHLVPFLECNKETQIKFPIWLLNGGKEWVLKCGSKTT